MPTFAVGMLEAGKQGRVPCPRLPWACWKRENSEHAHDERGHGTHTDIKRGKNHEYIDVFLSGR